MIPDISQDWFRKKFVPGVKSHLQEKNLPQKTVLSLDDAWAHSSEEFFRLEDGNLLSFSI